jgi:hypothetical protein
MRLYTLLIYAISLALPPFVQGVEPERHTFRSGEVWKDNNGVHINAHGGEILYHEGKCYRYGEYKGDSTYWNPKVPSWEYYRTEAGGYSFAVFPLKYKIDYVRIDKKK